MYDSKLGLYVAHCEQGPISICGQMANRHGLIAGATGTGKTVSLQTLAETFSQAGVPCFMADMKGDLSGVDKAGKMSGFIEKRCAQFGIEDPEFEGCPVRFYDVFGEKGHPMRTTISDMGPQLLSRLLGLNEIQAGVMDIVFRVADDRGLLLLDLKDLRAMLQYVGDNRAEFTTMYGNVSSASVGAIQRALLSFEGEGGELFFGEPALDIRDWMRTDIDGRGYINILSSDRLIQSPTVYSTFLLWMLTELFEKLPEVGDLDKPRMIFFFDEAHLLFDGAPKALVQKIVQVVKLIRSKGVGVYFISQSPSDIPNDVLAQLSNRVQHALRAYTPNDQKALRSAAKSFRANPAFDTEEALQALGVGEALVSVLDEKGVPTVVERANILPPRSSMSAAEGAQVQAAVNGSPLRDKYAQTEDRRSAYEVLEEDRQREAARAEEEARQAAWEKEQAAKQRAVRQSAPRRATTTASRSHTTTSRRQDPLEKAINSAANTVGRELGKQIVRGLFGNFKR